MDYETLLENSWAMVRTHEEQADLGRLEYLAEYIFDFTTYDSEPSETLACYALAVCVAIEDNATFSFIEDRTRYMWFLAMCNMPFFVSKITWGTSIRGAFWETEITLKSCGLWDGDKQLIEPLKFSREEWGRFVDGMAEFAKKGV